MMLSHLFLDWPLSLVRLVRRGLVTLTICWWAHRGNMPKS